MKRHLVVVHKVNALDDVNLASAGPLFAYSEGPERWPDLRVDRKIPKKRWNVRDGKLTEQPYGMCRASMIQSVPTPYVSLLVRRICPGHIVKKKNTRV